MSTLYDRVAAKRGGKAALAAARLRREVLVALHEAFQASGLGTQSEIARRLGVRRSAVNQVFRGDGNLRINTIAEYLNALGFELEVRLVPAGEPRRAELEERSPHAAFALWVTPPSAAYFDPYGAAKSLWSTRMHFSAHALPEPPHAIEMASIGVWPALEFGTSTPLVTFVVPWHSSSQRVSAKAIAESTSGQIAINPAGR